MKNPSFKIGMTAMEVLVEIVRVNPKIESLECFLYEPHSNTNEIPVARNNIKRLLFHDSPDPNNLKRVDIVIEFLEGIKTFLSQNELVISVLSRVRIKNKVYHIPMMDFCCPVSAENLHKIEEFLKPVGLDRGAILDSGRSYHFYGATLLSGKKWLSFLGDCGLSGLADPRYIFHRLKDRCGILRVSASTLRPKVPTVVSIL